jgi:hypothetical protein
MRVRWGLGLRLIEKKEISGAKVEIINALMDNL